MNFKKVSLVGNEYLKAQKSKKTSSEELSAHKRRFDACLKEYVDSKIEEKMAEIKDVFEKKLKGF